MLHVHIHRERNRSALGGVSPLLTVVDAILTLKAAFDKPIQEDRHALDNVIVSHYCKVIKFSSEALRGDLFQLVVVVAKIN